MKKSTFFSSLLVVMSTITTMSHAQQAAFNCGTDDYDPVMVAKHPAEAAAAQAQLMMERNDLFTHGEGRSSFTYIVPVVFHIVHDYGTENISDAQVLDEMAILNRDYAKLNADTSAIIPEFMGISSAINIEFRLATIDPDGNCTNGIDRIASKRTNNADDGSKLNPWPRRSYLNVWVVKTIGASGVAGYAYYPSSVQGLGEIVDGVIILHDYIGGIGTSQPLHSRALTHEIGHYLSLSHCWGSTNSPGVACGDDGIPDTPQTKGWDHCPANSSLAMICDTTIVENYQNFMEYSYCSVMFTHDQMLAMHAALNSNVSDRNHLWQPSNLIATGTSTVTTSNCAPIADFHGSSRMVCAGGSITFFDNSYNGTVSSRAWNFTGGTPASSTAATQSVVYNSPGRYPVSLSVSNSQGQDSVIRQEYVTVGPGWASHMAPIMEGFENANTIFTDDWVVNNYGADGVTWSQVNWAGSSGANCMCLNNYYNTHGEMDELITPEYDLSFLTGMTFSCKVAFAGTSMDTSNLKDKLRVMVSTNCGQSWTPLITKIGYQFVSGGANAAVFSPGYNANQWMTLSANMSSSYAQSRVRIKFEFTGSGYGNNVYLDDINITGTNVGVNESAAISTFDVYPNPSGGNSTIALQLIENSTLHITLCDLNGRVIRELVEGEMSAGDHLVPVNTAELAPGTYMIIVNDGSTNSVKRLSVLH